MKRLALPLLLVVLVVGTTLFFVSRGIKKAATVAANPDAAVATGKPIERPAASTPSGPPPGQAVSFDDDPVGALRLEGQVVDADEHPVGGATVFLSSHPPREIKSEADGSFVFEGLLARGYRLTAHADDGHAGPVSVNVTGKVEPVTLRLVRGLTLSVKVVDGENDKPVAGASVEVREIGSLAALADGKGVATLRGLPGGWTTVVVSARGFASQSLLWPLDKGSQAGVEKTVRLARGVAVRGKVVDVDGKPVAGARVLAEDAAALFSPSDERDAVESDAAGKWELPAIAAGTWRFSARHGKHAPGQSGTIAVDRTPPPEVVIRLAAAGTLAGVVKDGSGQPVPYATVRAAGDEGATRQASCDDKGAFLLEGLPRISTAVLAAHDTGISEVQSFDLAARPEQRDVVLVLTGSGAIAGLVVDEKGAPVPEARVIAIPEGGGSPAETTRWSLLGTISDLADQGGGFKLSGLPDGSYRLRATRSGGLGDVEVWQQEGLVAKTGDTGVKLVLPAESAMVGKVLFADGSAPESFNVATSAWSQRVASFSSKDGAFRIEGVNPGKRFLVVTGPQFASKTTDGFDVKPGGDTDVGTITVQRGRRVRGVVIGADGKPAANATVQVGTRFIADGKALNEGVGKQMGNRSATTGESGSFDIPGIGVKAVLAVAEHADGRSQVLPIPAGDDDVSITLNLMVPGVLEGTVKNGGAPMDGATVVAQQIDAFKGQFAVKSGKDGVYRFDRLAPGRYKVMAGRTGMLGNSLATAVTTIEAGQTSKLDVEIPRTDLSLAIAVAGAGGEKIETAMVFLFPGASEATSVKQMEDAIDHSAGSLDNGAAAGGKPYVAINLTAGKYTACVLVVPTDQTLLVKLNQDPDSYPVTCVRVVVASSPKEQATTVTATVPKP